MVERSEELLFDSYEIVQIAARAVLQREFKTARCAESRDGRRGEDHDVGIFDLRYGSLDACRDAVEVFAFSGTLIPRFEFAHESPVRTTVAADKAETVDHDTGSDQRMGGDDTVHLVEHFLGALHRSGRRQGDIDHEYAVVLGRDESRRGGAQQQHQYARQHDDDTESDGFHVHHLFHQAAVLVLHRFEEHVECPGEARSEGFACSVFFLGREEYGAQRRAERQGIHGRDQDGDGQGHTELRVERTSGPAHEGDRDEHCGHDQGDGYDGTGDLAHGVDRGFARRLIALVQFGMHRFDDHDRIVHHNRNGQYHGEEGEQVDRESEQVQEEERTDQRYDHRNRRDKGRAEVLQEDIHHDEHQNKGFDDGLDHFVDRGVQEVGGIHQDHVLDAFREILREAFQFRFDVFHHFPWVRELME